ncbi:MAG: hypothetical protein IPL95_03935 [Saprospiraceae bacterium]|nr:hypothetical protein [Saprospiraceae bacterium]
MIGNGINTYSLKNAMTVYKNGNTDLNGFVRIGEVSDGAPRIKTKR